MTCPDSFQAATYADGGLIGPCTATTATRPDPAPPQRYQATPASNAGDARTMLRQGGDFINLANEPDNLYSYNLSGMGRAPPALNDSPVHDLMQGGAVHSMLAGCGSMLLPPVPDGKYQDATARLQLWCWTWSRDTYRPASAFPATANTPALMPRPPAAIAPLHKVARADDVAAAPARPVASAAATAPRQT